MTAELTVRSTGMRARSGMRWCDRNGYGDHERTEEKTVMVEAMQSFPARVDRQEGRGHHGGSSRSNYEARGWRWMRQQWAVATAPLRCERGNRGGGGRAKERGESEGRRRASPWREGEAGRGKQEVAAARLCARHAQLQ